MPPTRLPSARFGFALDSCASTVVLCTRAGGALRHATGVCLASQRPDVDGAVGAHLGAGKVSFAGREDAMALTGQG